MNRDRSFVSFDESEVSVAIIDGEFYMSSNVAIDCDSQNAIIVEKRCFRLIFVAKSGDQRSLVARIFAKERNLVAQVDRILRVFADEAVIFIENTLNNFPTSIFFRDGG
jgi:hypothetical protein